MYMWKNHIPTGIALWASLRQQQAVEVKFSVDITICHPTIATFIIIYGSKAFDNGRLTMFAI